MDSWLEDLSTYQVSAEKELKWERYDFSKTIYKFDQHTSFVNKQVQFTSQASKLTSKSLFRKFNFSKFKVKAWRFYLHYLNVNCLLRKGLFCREVGIMVSYQIKKKEKKEGRGSQKEKKNSTFSSYTWNHVFIFSLH